MDLDQQPVGAGRNRGAAERGHHPRLAAGVRRVDDDRQMRLSFEHRNRSDIEHVAIRRLEGAYAALAENDVVIAAGGDVLGGHQPFVDRRRHAALEDDRLLDATHLLRAGRNSACCGCRSG